MLTDLMDNVWLAMVVGIVSVARTARFIIFDDFPPMKETRAWILSKYKEESDWKGLWECPFCLCPYLALGMLGWMWVSDLHWTWWVPNVVWAASYVAAIVVSYDESAE